MKKLKSLANYSHEIIIVLCALSLIPIIIISLYGFPFADDFGYSHEMSKVISEQGFNPFAMFSVAISQVISSWHTWQGTYSSIFLMTLQPGIFSEKIYFITTFIMLALIISSFLYFTKAALSILNANRSESLFVGTIITFSFIQIMPSPAEGLFWYNGSVHYITFLAGCLLMAGINIYAIKKGYSVIKIILCSLLCLFISGGNTVTGFLNIMLLFCFLLYQIPQLKKGAKSSFIAILIILLFAVLGFVINCIAPGNALRQSGFSNIPTFFETIKFIARYFFNFISDWMNLSYWLTLLILTPILLKLTKTPRGYSITGLVVAIVGFYGITCGMLSIPYYSAGNDGPQRLVNIVYGAMAFMSFILYAYILGLLQEKGILKFKYANKNWPYLIMQLVFLGVVILCGNKKLGNSTTLTAIRELDWKIPQTIHATSVEQYKILHNPEITDAVLPVCNVQSKLISSLQISETPGFWTHGFIETYFDKNSVIGLPPSEPAS